MGFLVSRANRRTMNVLTVPAEVAPATVRAMDEIHKGHIDLLLLLSLTAGQFLDGSHFNAAEADCGDLRG